MAPLLRHFLQKGYSVKKIMTTAYLKISLQCSGIENRSSNILLTVLSPCSEKRQEFVPWIHMTAMHLPSLSRTANLRADRSCVTLSSFLVLLFVFKTVSLCPGVFTVLMMQHSLWDTGASDQQRSWKGFYFHSKSLIFITWRTMSCIIKTRKPDGQFSPFLKNLLCCFLVCKHNHKISNL